MGEADQIVTVAKFQEAGLRDLGLTRVTTIPNAIDTSRFRPRPANGKLSEELGIHKAQIVVLVPANLHPRKRPFDVVESLHPEPWLRIRLYLHLMDVHAPYAYYAPREDFDSLSGSKWGEERILSEQEAPYNRWSNIETRPEWATEEMRHTLSYWKTRYASGVRAMDRRLGPFFDFLRRHGTLERSYFLLTSDHGEELFEHGDWSHGQNLYDHQLRVPLVIRPPGGLRERRRIVATVDSIDLMPTVLALAAGPGPGPVHDAGERHLRSSRGRREFNCNGILCNCNAEMTWPFPSYDLHLFC